MIKLDKNCHLVYCKLLHIFRKRQLKLYVLDVKQIKQNSLEYPPKPSHSFMANLKLLLITTCHEASLVGFCLANPEINYIFYSTSKPPSPREEVDYRDIQPNKG